MAGSAKCVLTYGEGIVASVTLKVKWDERNEIANNLQNKIWPYRTETNTFIKSISIDQIPNARMMRDGSGCKYVWSLMHLEFATSQGQLKFPPGAENKAVFYETVEPNGEMLKTSPYHLVWTADSKALTNEEAPAKLIMGMDYVVKWVGLASIPPAAFAVVDHVNASAVVSPSLGVTFAAETLLANAPVVSRTVGTQEITPWAMEQRFSYRENTWNKFWRQETATWDTITEQVGSAIRKVFPTSTRFNEILP